MELIFEKPRYLIKYSSFLRKLLPNKGEKLKIERGFLEGRIQQRSAAL
jgi:hypothetical protein